MKRGDPPSFRHTYGGTNQGRANLFGIRQSLRVNQLEPQPALDQRLPATNPSYPERQRGGRAL